MTLVVAESFLCDLTVLGDGLLPHLYCSVHHRSCTTRATPSVEDNKSTVARGEWRGDVQTVGVGVPRDDVFEQSSGLKDV
jgi:hypothetical protein